MTMIKQNGEMVQILLWYDRPEIVLLKNGPFEYILAVSSGDNSTDEETYVGASMTLGFLADYEAGKFDLRYALAHANLRRYWTFIYSPGATLIEINRLKKSSTLLTRSLPEAGFFSREHHKISVAARFIPDAVERFDIDGSWDLGEFSRFYNNVEDIYYIFNDIRRFLDPSTTDATKNDISKALERPWKGGGSYVAYYDKIANDNSPIAKLQVSGIKYNSPGYVAIKAKQAPFDDMIALLQSYSDDKVAVKKAYSTLYHFMMINKLLNRDGKKVRISETIKSSIKELASELDTYMPGISFLTFVKMANGDIVVAAKVLLSVFRRMDRLYLFFEEGRVKYKAIETDPFADSE